VYRSADLLLVPSAREGFALSCAEAMSVGVPVLRTRTSGTEAMILENITGRATPIDHDAFLAAAKSMLADSPGLDRMGLAAAKLVREKLRFDRQLAETIDLYRLMIGDDFEMEP
jgi:glycosyltransferase involved in cell wall biosynthesis